MEKTIKETTRLLLNGTLTKEDADKILLDLCNVIGRNEQLAISALQKIEKVHSESYSAQVARNALKTLLSIEALIHFYCFCVWI